MSVFFIIIRRCANIFKYNSPAICILYNEHIFRTFVVVGILKMGWKKLYLFDRKGSRTEAMVYCLLDFYIHETRQRQGYGNKLFEHMLKVLKL